MELGDRETVTERNAPKVPRSFSLHNELVQSKIVGVETSAEAYSFLAKMGSLKSHRGDKELDTGGTCIPVPFFPVRFLNRTTDSTFSAISSLAHSSLPIHTIDWLDAMAEAATMLKETAEGPRSPCYTFTAAAGATGEIRARPTEVISREEAGLEDGVETCHTAMDTPWRMMRCGAAPSAPAGASSSIAAVTVAAEVAAAGSRTDVSVSVVPAAIPAPALSSLNTEAPSVAQRNAQVADAVAATASGPTPTIKRASVSDLASVPASAVGTPASAVLNSTLRDGHPFQENCPPRARQLPSPPPPPPPPPRLREPPYMQVESNCLLAPMPLAEEKASAATNAPGSPAAAATVGYRVVHRCREPCKEEEEEAADHNGGDDCCGNNGAGAGEGAGEGERNRRGDAASFISLGRSYEPALQAAEVAPEAPASARHAAAGGELGFGEAALCNPQAPPLSPPAAQPRPVSYLPEESPSHRVVMLSLPWKDPSGLGGELDQELASIDLDLGLDLDPNLRMAMSSCPGPIRRGCRQVAAPLPPRQRQALLLGTSRLCDVYYTETVKSPELPGDRCGTAPWLLSAASAATAASHRAAIMDTDIKPPSQTSHNAGRGGGGGGGRGHGRGAIMSGPLYDNCAHVVEAAAYTTGGSNENRRRWLHRCWHPTAASKQRNRCCQVGYHPTGASAAASAWTMANGLRNIWFRPETATASSLSGANTLYPEAHGILREARSSIRSLQEDFDAGITISYNHPWTATVRTYNPCYTNISVISEDSGGRGPHFFAGLNAIGTNSAWSDCDDSGGGGGGGGGGAAVVYLTESSLANNDSLSPLPQPLLGPRRQRAVQLGYHVVRKDSPGECRQPATAARARQFVHAALQSLQAKLPANLPPFSVWSSQAVLPHLESGDDATGDASALVTGDSVRLVIRTTVNINNNGRMPVHIGGDAGAVRAPAADAAGRSGSYAVSAAAYGGTILLRSVGDSLWEATDAMAAALASAARVPAPPPPEPAAASGTMPLSLKVAQQDDCHSHRHGGGSWMSRLFGCLGRF